MANRCVHGKTAILRCQECHEVARARITELEKEVAEAEQSIMDTRKGQWPDAKQFIHFWDGDEWWSWQAGIDGGDGVDDWTIGREEHLRWNHLWRAQPLPPTAEMINAPRGRDDG